MLIIGADTGPVTSLFLIVPAPKTKDTAPASTCRMTVSADSIVRRPPRDAMQIVIGNILSAGEIKLVRTALRGARLAAVGWARSFVRDPPRRELLFDLETARRQIFAREGKSA